MGTTDEMVAELVDAWPVDNAAVGWWSPREPDRVGRVGDTGRPFALASVTKLLTATAVLVAVEEGSVDLADTIQPGITLAHLLAHASGLSPTGEVAAEPGTKRIYSNAGYDLAADHVAAATGIDFATYLDEAVAEGLGLANTHLDGSAAYAATASVDDLLAVGAEWLSGGRILSADTVRNARRVAFAGLRGIVPGYGMQDPCDWGLGPEIKAHKTPHWTGAANTPATFGHFGQSGTFLWIDPDAEMVCVALADRDFGDWAINAWPALADAVLASRT